MHCVTPESLGEIQAGLQGSEFWQVKLSGMSLLQETLPRKLLVTSQVTAGIYMLCPCSGSLCRLRRKSEHLLAKVPVSSDKSSYYSQHWNEALN